MGKGSIISGGEEGHYTISREIYRARLNDFITRLTNRIAEITAKIAVPGQSDEELSPLYIQLASLETKKRALQNLPEDEEIQAWCADLTEDLTGTVGLAEIAYQEDIGVNILPGYAEGTAESPAVWDQERDGQFGFGKATTPFAVYLTWLLLPWAQVWKPRFRYATITEIDYDEDTCTIELETVTSRAQGIDVTVKPGMETTLENVPIEYMQCDAWAFEEGDSVLVKFENFDWDSPKVIGFKSEPKRCPGGACLSKESISGPERPECPEVEIQTAFPTIYEDGGDIITAVRMITKTTLDGRTFRTVELPFGDYEIDISNANPNTLSGFLNRLINGATVNPFGFVELLGATLSSLATLTGTKLTLYEDYEQTTPFYSISGQTLKQVLGTRSAPGFFEPLIDCRFVGQIFADFGEWTETPWVNAPFFSYHPSAPLLPVIKSIRVEGD